MILGVVLLIVGVVGFFTDGMLLFFEVDSLHNTVHILSGVIGMVASNKGQTASRLYLMVFGVIYALVTVLGFAMQGNILSLFSVNDADNYLHGAIALVSLGTAFTSKK
jgi:hypothetical protein